MYIKEEKLAITKADKYCQKLVVDCNISAGADTLTVDAFTDAYSPDDNIGFVIQEVSYHIEDGYLTQLLDGDRVKFGLSFLQAFGAGGPEANDPGIIDHNSIIRNDLGAVAADVVVLTHTPITKRFDHLVGGGWIVHPVNLYAFTYPDAALGGLILMRFEIKYFKVELSEDLYRELWQAIYVRQV